MPTRMPFSTPLSSAKFPPCLETTISGMHFQPPPRLSGTMHSSLRSTHPSTLQSIKPISYFSKSSNKQNSPHPSKSQKWDDYSIALNSLAGPTSGIAGHSVLQTDREELAQGYSGLIKAHRGSFQVVVKASMVFSNALPAIGRISSNPLWTASYTHTRENLRLSQTNWFRTGGKPRTSHCRSTIRVGKGGAYDAIVRPNSWYEAWMLEPTTLLLVAPSLFLHATEATAPFLPSHFVTTTKLTPTSIISPTGANVGCRNTQESIRY